ncbi:CYTH and CHAD domain-containing protein [Cellulosimicrobium marinum]|uniref:CYTH and CHAD domain-containing protein n=1 Tax=Cellulosimicrobium marinum TaxID=1638992 RepID=UPI001E3F8A17|nr:CYTH and CHAD domain-containing protein [Cellulosimicrobium marinum]MCB7137629.1 CYTH and CHAD domain-containing protein [Cellulosimicrobium marinum]
MSYREVERTLRVPDGWRVPPVRLDGLTTRLLDPVDLDAVYLDTVGLRLLARGVTLRRRSGGKDAGWHLKLPLPGGDREEVRRPLGGDAPSDTTHEPAHEPTVDGGPVPPDELAALVRGLARGAPLVAVARVRTRRGVTVILDAADRVLVEVADDRVTGERLVAPRGRTGAWREVEVELAPDGLDAADPAGLLDDVVDALVDSGARPGPAAPKLSRALGDPDLGPRGDAGPLPDHPTAGDVVVHHVREQVAELVRLDPAVRRDVPDAVHKARVAARRLRSALATFRPLLDRERTEPVRDALRWWGQVLGEARDAEVARDRVRTVLDALPAELVVGPVRAHVVDELDARYRAALRDAVGQMDGARYLTLLDTLDALAEAPPLSPRADRPAADELPRHVRRAWRRTRHRAEAAQALAGDPGAGDRYDELLHDVRKAAKRARYAGEVVAPSLPGRTGRHAARFARRLEAVQDALGERHDAVGLGRALRTLGMQAHLSGENGFSHGLLVGVERQRADAALEGFAAAWERARRPRMRRWTSS